MSAVETIEKVLALSRRVSSLFSLLCVLCASASGLLASASTQPSDTPVIILTAFGTSVLEARKAFDHIDAAARRRYPDHEIRWAFTSRIIRDKLRDEHGIVTHSVEDVIADLQARGTRAVVFQSLHVVPGQEYTKIGEAYAGRMIVAAGAALLTGEQDIDDVIAALEPEIRPGVPNVIVAHGNEKYSVYNDSLLAFAKRIEARYPNVLVASVEGQPGDEPLERARELARRKGAVHFIPLMIVAGDHIENDVLGGEAESWKSRIGAERTTVSPPLGFNDAVLEVYWRHLDRALVRVRSERARDLGQAGADAREGRSAYLSWKIGLNPWLRRGVMLVELVFFIAVGIFVGQVLEVSGIIRYLAVLTWPFTRLGWLSKEAGPAFLMAFQSGAIANTMLVSARDGGHLNRRQLYTSVLVVSCLSLFAHLPTYIPAVAVAFGPQGATALFAVRFGAIFAEVFLVLAVSGLVVRRWTDQPAAALAGMGITVPLPDSPVPAGMGGGSTRASETGDATGDAAAHAAAKPGRCSHGRSTGRPFWATVWSRSRRTLLRLLMYVVPTVAAMAALDELGFFRWLGNAMPWLFQLSFLPPQASVIIPAQAANLYNGAVAAATFLDESVITVRQAVLVMLVGTVLTAPIRTLRHALPTYMAVLGARAGLALAVAAQVLRIAFLIVGIWVLMMVWR